ncbi:MAG: hypothetical protein WC679_13645 [Bacteroidales bacterium]|jgi:hypothetical protein
MKKPEIILVVITLIALFMKYLLIPWGSSITSVTMILLSLFYFPFGFAFLNKIPLRKIFKKDAYKGITTMRMIGSIGVGMSLSAIYIGILFKLNSWPGANHDLIVGLATLVIILVIALFRKAKLKEANYFFMFSRIVILSILGIIFLISPNLPIERIRYGNHPAYIKALENYLNHPDNPELKEKEHTEYLRATLSKEDFDMYLKYENETNQK